MAKSAEKDIIAVLKQRVEKFEDKVSIVDVGIVAEVGDGIARIHGLGSVGSNELLRFPGDVMGIAMNLEEGYVSAIILGEDAGIKEGDEVKATGRVAEVPVGSAMIGRVIDALGRPIDGKGDIKTASSRPVERIAPNVVARKSVDTPVQTGIKSIDSMFPIGRGQRQLIIGDRSTGKTAVTIDTIINQKGGDLICIYVAIGQKASKVAQVVAQLEANGAMEHTVVVAANASDSVAMQYLAPYTGCAIGEEFMEQGKEALIVYDDLSKHAWAYRQMSLLLRRPPGREAYPGDLFYLHSRLLERAAKLDEAHGGGSLTALPIIETQAGDVSAYVPTNVISITDGQIYMETDLFNAGIRPAINVGLSVSRVGSAAQIKAMKQVAGKLKLEMAQYRELAAFAQFGAADLDKATKNQLERGKRITEILKQSQFTPVPVGKQVMMFYAITNNYLDDVNVEDVKEFEASFYNYVERERSGMLDTIVAEKKLTPEIEKELKEAIESFKSTFMVGKKK
jgi:F-type H+-transporting ATPase subunit alpha